MGLGIGSILSHTYGTGSVLSHTHGTGSILSYAHGTRSILHQSDVFFGKAILSSLAHLVSLGVSPYICFFRTGFSKSQNATLMSYYLLATLANNDR